jgi:two-component system response regulator FixJ
MRAGPTVFVVEDDESMRRSLRWLIESIGIAVETYQSAEEFLNSFDPQWAGCVLLDVRMPGMGGMALQRELNARGVRSPLVFMTAYPEVAVAVEALKQGAYDFIEKPFSGQQMLDCLRRAIDEDRRRRRQAVRHAVISRRMASLTPREREVLDLVIAGETSRSIAGALGLTEKTVELHRSHVNKKMKVRNAVELVRLVEGLGKGNP